MSEGRFHRQELLFGKEGQARIEECRIAVVGLGGLGSHVAQQLAYLGTSSFVFVDGDRTSRSNLNRLIGATPSDVEVGTPKVVVAERTVRQVSADVDARNVQETFISDEGFAQLQRADFVFGCVDNDASRLILNELCQAYEKPYLDIATDINATDKSFGGRLLFADGRVCLSCKDLLDQAAIRSALSSDQQREDEERIYGVRREALDEVGPAVVSLNGILASLAVTEFMVSITGIRVAATYLEYKGPMAIVTRDRNPAELSCYFCKDVRGKRDAADVDRYIREGWGERLFWASEN
jgi:hypothetical protein